MEGTLKLLVVGLGNPGNEYARTRHNLGFMAVDALHLKYGLSDWREKPKYLFAKAKAGPRSIILAKPTTFMNLSGEAVLALKSLYKIPAENIVVIHDDLDLVPGRVKVKRGGGSAGHNGLKSIDGKIGPDYWRVRIGIGHPRGLEPSMDVAAYVLARPGKDDADKLAAAIGEIVDAFPSLVP
jgi:PTH1 family peptidyl-tRNA hydrolase